MIETYEIRNVKDHIELDDMVEQAARERNYRLDNSLSYQEQSEFLEQEAHKADKVEDDLLALAKLLEIAESVWWDLDQ